MNKTCGLISPSCDAVSGIPKLRIAIRNEIERLITQENVSRFLCGMNLGGELLCAEVVLELKQYYPQITLESVFPYENQAEHWTEAQRENYYKIASRCDEEILLQYHYDERCMYHQRKYIADSSNIILTVNLTEEMKELNPFGKGVVQINPVTASVRAFRNDG